MGIRSNRFLAACGPTAALALIAVNTGVSRPANDVRAQTVVPPCPRTTFAANGNMRPLFCVVDNPAALHYFAPLAKRTFALGPNATPRQVSAALVADYKHGGTVPTLCSIYQLAAWRNGWRFGVSPLDNVGSQLNLPRGWCSEPSFPRIW